MLQPGMTAFTFLAASLFGLASATPPAVPRPPTSSPSSSPSVESAAPIRVAVYHRTTLIPQACDATRGAYDLLIHFHGVETAVEPAFHKSGLDAVLVIINLGEFSGPYENQFADGGSFTRLLDDIQYTVAKHCPARPLGRVALSAWSGGYGAIYRILTREAEANRVDAVLLADGLHAGFVDPKSRTINALQMAPFARFAEKAKRSERLFAMTHTQIGTPYASTTETANYLLEHTGAVRTWTQAAEPRPGMRLSSQAREHGLFVFGYAGDGKRDHCDHLLALGDTLFPVLREHWRLGASDAPATAAATPASAAIPPASEKTPANPVAALDPMTLLAAEATVVPGYHPSGAGDDQHQASGMSVSSTLGVSAHRRTPNRQLPSSPSPDQGTSPTAEDARSHDRESMLPG